MGKNHITDERNMVVFVMDKFVMELFHISKLDQVFPITETEKEGIIILSKKRNENLLKVQDY